MNANDKVLDKQKPSPWGFWATVGFSCVIAAAYFLSIIILCVGFIVAAKIRNPQLDIGKFAQSLSSNGLFFAVATCAATPLVVGLCVLFAKIRRNITVKQYDAYGITTIFVGGLLLGWARLKSNSIYIPIAIHAVWNLIATIECVIYLALA